MKIIITEEHLKRAESTEWNTTTCLVAEATGVPVANCGYTSVCMQDGSELKHNGKVLQQVFDSYHYGKTQTREAVLAMLPFELEITPEPTKQ